MFTQRYFGNHFYAGRYFPHEGAEAHLPQPGYAVLTQSVAAGLRITSTRVGGVTVTSGGDS